MCRLFSYLGPTQPLKTLLVEPPNSLVNQARAPRHHPLLQLAGWGFALWSRDSVDPALPIIYRRACPAFFDDNLSTLVPALRGEQLLAHVRAATYKPEGLIADENCHPFAFEGAPWIMAHNGFLLDWRAAQGRILALCHPQDIQQRRGTTDTELVYTLFLAMLREQENPYDFSALRAALANTVHSLIEIQRFFENDNPMKLKLMLMAPDRLLAVNYGAGRAGALRLEGDYQTYRRAPIDSPEFLLSTLMEPLYLRAGRRCADAEGHYPLEMCEEHEMDTVLVASEPLTDDEAEWQALGFGEMVLAERIDHRVRLTRGSVFI